MKGQKKRLFGSAVQPRCDYCAHAAGEDGCTTCLLGKKASVSGACNHFRYNPLRRVPLVQPPLPKPNPQEFKL